MGAFLKKDLLLIWRDRNELLLLLLMPFILIAILGFSLSSMMENENEHLHMKVAIVNDDSLDQGWEQFQRDLATESGMPAVNEQAVNERKEQFAETHPLAVLDQMLQQEEVLELVESMEMNREAAYEALYNEEIEAVLHIPADFTYHYLSRNWSGAGEVPLLQIQIREEPTLRARIFTELIATFIARYNLEAAIYAAESADLRDQPQPSAAERVNTGSELPPIGGKESLERLDPVSSFQYYTIAISAMFVLFVASSIAGKAYLEKRQHIFERIIISGAQTGKYLAGKMASGVMITWTQIMVLFVFSQLVFGVFSGKDAVFWAGIAFFALVFSLVIAALGSLLTSVNFLLDSQSFSQFFGMALVSLLAFIGGSFAPKSMLPDWINKLSLWTPNGLYMSVFFQWMQGADISQLAGILINMIVLSAVLLALAVLIFPKRRRA
ncbi:ABC transporter permease [Paenibacillus senegalensis]|uniref:ABC transporter permease n=1 Tax=Paenibacillus senegalensis TaxID=1465766 RepID=UPI000288EAED|nr:ABC transporter permease [Paenibacillus senegalensis]